MRTLLSVVVGFVSLSAVAFSQTLSPSDTTAQQQVPNTQYTAPPPTSSSTTTQTQPSPYAATQAPPDMTVTAPTQIGQASAQPSTSLDALSARPVASTPPPYTVQFPPTVIVANDGTQAPVFGSDLFTGAFSGSTVGTQNDYKIQPGDIIDVKTYGSVSLDFVGRVDANGQLFLPIRGPISLSNATRSGLNAVLQTALSQIYTNIKVFADLVQPGAIGVYVTGNVFRPGRYLGSSTDTALYYLDKAGGIDGQRGSFRNITIRHKSGRQEEVDLYDFRLNGAIKESRFYDGDVIIVGPRGPMVVATGIVRSPFAFELKTPPGGDLGIVYPGAGAEILKYARPDRTVTNALIHNFENGKPNASYVPLVDFAAKALGDGDHVEFRSDTLATNISVLIAAKLNVSSIYVVPKGTTLGEVLATIPIDGSNADPLAVHILRKSVADQQKKALDESLLNLQKEAYSATAISPEQAQLQASQSSLVDKFVQAAKQVQPDGQVAVYRDGKFYDVRLEEGDQIVIPEKTDVVLVSGEVLAPGAFAHRPGASLRDYIDDAGGFTNEADTDRFVLRGRDGAAHVARGGDKPKPGDEIMVLPAVADQDFQLAKDISQLIFQTALTAATVLRL